MSEKSKAPKKGRQKNANGLGTIYQRPSGHWTGSVTIGKKADGSPDRRSASGMTKKEVDAKLRKIQHDFETGTYVEPSRVLLSDYLTTWLERVSRPTIRETTHARYESILRLHLIPLIGKVRLQHVTPRWIVDLMYQLQQRGASPSTRKRAYGLLHTALGKAEDLQEIPKNPCARVDAPKVPEAKRKALTEEELTRFLDAASSTPYHTMFLLAVATGLRPGELLALQWEDIDFDRGILTVRHTQQELRGKVSLAEPKTKASKRTLSLPYLVVERLRVQKVDQQQKHPKASRMFTSPHGHPLRNKNFTLRIYKPLLDAAGIGDGVTFHSLRHTAATLLGAAGVSPRVVQQRLGHTSIGMTLGIYTHVFANMDEDAANKVGSIIEKKLDVGGQSSVAARLQQPEPDDQ